MNNLKPLDAEWQSIREYPGCLTNGERRAASLNRIANAALYAASTVGIVTALFFLLTL